MILHVYLVSIFFFCVAFLFRIFSLSGFGFGFAWLTIYLYVIHSLLHSRKTFSLYTPFAIKWLALFLFFCLLSVLQSTDRKAALEWLFYLTTCSIYFYIGTTLIDETNVDKVLWTICLGSLLPAAFAIFQFYTGYLPPNPLDDTVDYILDRLRPPAGMMDANYFSFQMYIGFASTMCLFFKSKKILYLPVACLILFAGALTFSRTFYFCMILTGVYLALSVPTVRAKIVASITGLLFVALISFFFSDALLSKVESGGDVVSGLSRILQLERGVNMFGAHWFAGIGGGNFVVSYPYYGQGNFVTDVFVESLLPRGLDYARLDELAKPNTMHNVFLKLLFETGILGILSFAVFLFNVLFKKRQSKMAKANVIIRNVMTVSLLLFSCFMPIDTFIFFWILLLIIYSINDNKHAIALGGPNRAEITLS